MQLITILAICFLLTMLCYAKDFDQEKSILCCFCRCSKWFRKSLSKSPHITSSKDFNAEDLNCKSDFSTSSAENMYRSAGNCHGKQKMDILRFLEEKNKTSLSADCIYELV